MLPLRLVLLFLLIAGNTLLHVPPLLVVGVFKALLPFDRVRRACNPMLTGLAESWIAFNGWLWDRFTHTRLQVQADAALHIDGHYLVLANHQSWVDILVLQKVFNRRIPFMRFFLKRQLIWVPLLGLAWWALDFPFMGRYSKKQIAKNPELAGRDIEATRRACAKFRAIPVAIMNFVEGTRFTPAKHDAQKAPYQHLLKPKSGGVAFVLDAMGDGLHDHRRDHRYPGHAVAGGPAGRPHPGVQVRIRQRDPGSPAGATTMTGLPWQWMNGVWEQKDADIAAMLTGEQAQAEQARAPATSAAVGAVVSFAVDFLQRTRDAQH
jgi:1-acyl-sn-glycerol-3-phosphate acyltransferase